MKGKMLSNKPYLVRAFYEWIVDSACTPFVVINATYPRCNVPETYVEDGEITLNVSPTAVRDLKITNDTIEFRASFGGIVHIVSAPVKAVLAIYAMENQQGMFFDYDDMEEDGDGGSELDTTFSSSQTNKDLSLPKKEKGARHLKLVE